MLTRRRVLAGIAGATAVAATAAHAQTFPTRMMTLVVPYPPGGPTDAIARIVAQELAAAFATNVVVENKAGASGAIGTRYVARSEPDGHTIVFGNNQTHGNNMFLLKEPGYDAIKDFAPLVGVGAFEHVYVVRNGLPVKTIQELIALAKKDPLKLNYGSTGVGSGSHLSTELFMVRTGTKMTHVPFRGAPPLVQELVGDRIDVANSTLPSVLGQIQAGTVRAIAIASPRRNASIPDVPTLREQGVTDADADSWAAFFAPVATPQWILDRLSRELVAILSGPNARAAILKTGFTMNVRAPDDFRPYLAQEIAVWRDVIRTAGVKPE